MFPQLQFYRRPGAIDALRQSERQRNWLWSRDYFPTQLLELQQVYPLSVPVTRPVLAQAFWCYQAAAKFLFFEGLIFSRVNRAGAAVHQGALNSKEDVAQGSAGGAPSSSEEWRELLSRCDIFKTLGSSPRSYRSGSS